MDIIRKIILRVKNKYLLLSVSGIVCALIQSTLELPFAAFISYAPLMYCICRYDSRRELLKSFVCFFVPYYFYQLAFLTTVYSHIDMNRAAAVSLLLLAAIALTLWECLLMSPVFLFIWLRKNNIFDVVSVSILIAAGEWLQEAVPFLSFPWSAVWLGATGKPILIQTANILGCRLVTVLILCVNGFISLAVMEKKRLVPALGGAAVMGIILGYGAFSLNRVDNIIKTSEPVTVLIAQDEMEGRKKAGCSALECAQSYSDIISSAEDNDAKLVILPETAVPKGYDENAEEFDMIAALAKDRKATVISGCFFHFDGDEYNALYAVDGSGKACEPYFKQVLVPFGERDPFAFFSGESTLCECDDDEHTKPLETDVGSVGCVICIESVYPETVKKQASQGAQILCVCTNDSWFGESYARKLHFRHSIMRAAENGKYLLRSGNCGISAIIKPTGEIQQIRRDTSKGVVIGEAALIDHETFYSGANDLFAVFPALLTVFALIKMYEKKGS